MLKTGLEGMEEGRGEETNSRPSLLHRTTGTCNSTTFNHAAAQFRPVLRIRICTYVFRPFGSGSISQIIVRIQVLLSSGKEKIFKKKH
jgi:hypothetical protein